MVTRRERLAGIIEDHLAAYEDSRHNTALPDGAYMGEDDPSGHLAGELIREGWVRVPAIEWALDVWDAAWGCVNGGCDLSDLRYAVIRR